MRIQRLITDEPQGVLVGFGLTDEEAEAAGFALDEWEVETEDHGLSFREFQLAPARILAEIGKTVMVCHNCHGEIHGNLCQTPLNPLNGILQNRLRPLDGMSWKELVGRAGFEPAHAGL